MSQLEAQLRAIAARGELTYLSVVPVAGKGDGGVVFVAQVSPASRWGHVEGRDADPVNALLKAIDGLPKAMKKPTREPAPEPPPPAKDDGFTGQPEPEPWDN